MLSRVMEVTLVCSGGSSGGTRFIEEYFAQRDRPHTLFSILMP